MRSMSSEPAVVIITPRRSRSNSRTPSASSSSRICALREGWDTWQCSAARRNLDASAYWICRRVKLLGLIG